MSLLSDWRIMFIRRSPVDEDVPDSHFLLWRCPNFALDLLLIQWNHTCSELCFACSWLYVGNQPYILCFYVWMCFMTVHKQNLAPAPRHPLFLEHWSSAHPDGHPRSYACIVCICPAVGLIPPALLLCPPAQEQGWEKLNGDVWAEEARTRGKNERMTQRGEAVLEWLWDKWGSERGQGQGWGKQSISLTHTLRDIPSGTFGPHSFPLSPWEEKKKLCLCFWQCERMDRGTTRKMFALFFRFLAALNCNAVNG